MSNNKAEQAVAYAALILADENIAITPEKLQTLLKAAGIEDIEPIWTTLFANALKDKKVKDILTTVTVAGPATGGGEGAEKEKPDGENDGDAAGGKEERDGIDIDVESDDEAFCDLFS